jgi:hypothetical protein
MVPGLYVDQDSGEKLVDEEPALWIIFFFIQKRNDQNTLQMMVCRVQK